MPKAVKLWQTAISKLRLLPAEPQLDPEGCGYFATSLHELLPTVTEFVDSDRTSSSEWKQLVNELKVSEGFSRCRVLPFS
jgi:hypothetical protein